MLYQVLNLFLGLLDSGDTVPCFIRAVQTLFRIHSGRERPELCRLDRRASHSAPQAPQTVLSFPVPGAFTLLCYDLSIEPLRVTCIIQ
jgi:hypothetical protein